MLHAARGNIQDAKRTQKLAIFVPSHNFVGLYLRNYACIDNRTKLVKQQYLLHMPSQYGELGPLTAETSWRVWGTQANFNGVRVLASLLQRRRKSTKLCTMFGRLLGSWYTIYTFAGALAPYRNSARCKIHFCAQVLRSPVLAALLHGTGEVVVSQNFAAWHKYRTMELSLLIIFNRGRHLYSEGGHHVGHRYFLLQCLQNMLIHIIIKL